MTPDSVCEPHWLTRGAADAPYGATLQDRRRAPRVSVRWEIEVHERGRYLGHFWTREASAGGLFLSAEPAVDLEETILRLGFQVEGVELFLRGTVIHRVPGEGVGIQLAFWRREDRSAHTTYRRLVGSARWAAQGPHKSNRGVAIGP